MVLLRRTRKGQEELLSRVRALPLRERGVLFLADGTRSSAEVRAAIGHGAGELIEQLLASGHLELRRPAEPASPPAAQARSALAPTPQQHEADTLPGRRSLAATRMYLFDVCERTFSRGRPELAERLREGLRNARERASMLDVAEAMLGEIEALAGQDRARTVRDRIEALVPEADGPDTARSEAAAT